MNLERADPRLLITVVLVAGVLFQLLLGTSYVAASLDPLGDSTGLPVVVVNLDDGPRGAQFLAALQGQGSPVSWQSAGTRAEAVRLLETKAAYGALVLPANFTSALESYATDAPHAAQVETLTNPGASTSGNLVAERAIALALDALRTRVREQAIGAAEVGTSGLGALTLEQARFLAQPVRTQATVVNPVPAHGANGLAPTYLAMAAWIGGYIGSAALERFRPQTRLTASRRTAFIAGAALVQGALAAFLIRRVGLPVPDGVALALFLVLGTWMAYSLVTLLVDLFGLAGIMPAFAVLALGLPAAGAIYPVEMLPPFFAALHEASPFTWLVEGLRTLLYAPAAGDMAANAWRLALLGTAATASSLTLAHVRKRRAEADAEASFEAA